MGRKQEQNGRPAPSHNTNSPHGPRLPKLKQTISLASKFHIKGLEMIFFDLLNSLLKCQDAKKFISTQGGIWDSTTLGAQRHLPHGMERRNISAFH